MTGRPAYFEQIRQRAEARWEQLEGDPELAAPWWQLFKQVQSPRHIVSELLQNADDAGATEARVSIEDGAFIFKHNGEDFTEEHFASLCRFGYSNKRALHTIGFRGIGFKSTFSLGKRVELITPTLSVAFDAGRFTQPHWANDDWCEDGFTTVRVAIEGKHRRAEVEKNLQEWLKSPISLLFFRNIRQIGIGEETLKWGSCGPGPVAETEWLALDNDIDKLFLLARSKPEPFPAEALEEIEQERMLSAEVHAEFPPCSIEIVLGAKGRLYVVLPTGVKTELPFACNAPFIQDPARLKIKDLETSPTNRWLLERAGRLAAQVMLEWLGKTAMDPAERARAYELMPDVDRDNSSLEGTCSATTEVAFAEAIENEPVLLSDDGVLAEKGLAIILPRVLHEVWPGTQAATLFDDEDRPALSRHISNTNREKLQNWNLVDEIDDNDALRILSRKHFPKPENWQRLLTLWAYLERVSSTYRYYVGPEALHIVPVQGKDVLCSANEVVRLGEKKLVPAEEDWRFLGDRLAVLNQNWLRFLTERRRLAERDGDDEQAKQVAAADDLLKRISLDQPSDTGTVINQVSADFFSQDTVTLTDSVRIAQIAAKLGAKTGDAFKFACEDRTLRTIDAQIIHDADGSLELVLPENWGEAHLLHPDYGKSFTSCTKEEWQQWVSSGNAGLYSFVPLTEDRSKYLPRAKLDSELKRRQFSGIFSSTYQSPFFIIKDWDFPAMIWEHWEALAKDGAAIWGKVAEQIMSQRDSFWAGRLAASVIEEATNGRTRTAIRSDLAPRWIMRLREKPCLRDTHGVLRKPTELLRRTPETEALLDVEPFIHGLLDTPKAQPVLDLLGVGSTPTGVEKLLARLQVLAKAESTEAHETDKWYRRLDQLIDGCSTQNMEAIKSAFTNDRLILTDTGRWERADGVFLSANDEDAPGAEVVRASVRHLMLWTKVGVEDRPTPELAISWLQGLTPGPLSQNDARRARSLLARYASRVWRECGHWLSLSGEWVAVEEFEFALTMQPMIPWSHLHQWVKQKTANFVDLPLHISQADPFAELPLLAAQIEERFDGHEDKSAAGESRAWLKQLGFELQRILLDDEQETDRIRSLGYELANSKWRITHDLEIVSYIGGKPAGTARQVDALWDGKQLHTEDKPLHKLARAVPQELGRVLRRGDIIDAIKMCFERDAVFVTGYMESNFTLIPREQVLAIPQVNDVGDEAGDTAPPLDDDGPMDDEGHDEDHVAPDGEASDVTTQENEHEVSEEPNEKPENGFVVTRPRKQRPAQPPLMERFALGKGFRKDDDNRFFNEDGKWIAKGNGSLFPWELRSASGDVLNHYWPKSHCLEREPLQLEAEVWNMVDRFPDKYRLVLVNADNEPIEITGDNLREMQDQGALTLHPSTYRLVYEE